MQMTAPTAAAETTVKVSTTPIFPEIPLGQARKDFQVLLRVEAPAAAARPEARVPIDVVAVLDVSGSMNDPAAVPPERTTTASRLDLLKTAAKFMVAKLEDGDRLSIVAFNDRPVKELSSGLLYMSADGRRNAMRSVDQLEARGGTAVVPAFEEAVKVLDGRQQGDGRNRLGFIVLLTDGEDTSGFTLSERRREGIRGALGRYPVHTLGLGTAHDPEVLLYLAQESHGTYSFVDDENIGDVAGALAVCVGGLSTVVAVDTRVVLKADELNGVRIDRVDSGGYDSSVSCAGTSCEVSVGVLYAGEVKHFVVHLQVPASAPSSSSTEGGYYCDGLGVCDHYRHHRHEQHLLAVGYSYRDHPNARAITVQGHGVFVQRSPAVLDGVRQAPVLSPSSVVLQHIVRFELLEVVAGVVQGELITDDDRARAADVLQLRWEEFRACHQFWGGGLDLMSGLEKEVDGMVSSIRAGVAAYVYAWVSSHQMQRATSIGSPEKAVVEFVTPAMRLLLEEARKLPRWQVGTAAWNVQHAGGCVDDFEVVERRLEVWSKVKQHLMSSFQEQPAVGDDEHHHLAAVFQEASLEAIDRAMHRDIYLVYPFIITPRISGLSSTCSI
jgi:Mg-chelatase subunit ChlD